ncbi:MAG TPA: transglutaminase family protein [Solirubrobacteraceae bacterium]|jgi:transglutaminase-like putative cysteine protease|nr:transglutaminase family protein [Solirubrobacteraceae bacterium]
MTTTYRVTHRTEYEYERVVSSSYSQLHLLPRDVPGQHCRTADVAVEPSPDDYRERTDFFGNRVVYVAIHSAHRALSVTATSEVEVAERPGELSLFGQRPWEEAREAVRSGSVQDPVDAAQFVLDSPLVAVSDAYREYAAASFTPGRHLLDGVTSLCSRIHADFAYAPGSTSVTTRLEEVFEQREGVCQDFAHVGIACLRSMGLPARYVSGYLETNPPPGRAKLAGVDGSHAWLSVLVPDAGWLDVDPTNDQLVSSRYVVTAYGRDYNDVPPLNGVIYTEGKTESLRVLVDVVVLPD